MIEIDGLTKRYGDKTAVDGLSFVVEPVRAPGPVGPQQPAGAGPDGRILAKLGLRDRVQAVVLAYESRLIAPGTSQPEGPC